MPTPTFKRISLEQFTQLLARFPFTRQINAVHMHHTWRPRRADFTGHQTIVGMWRYHTEQLGWRDIAQHITIDPEGFIWLGRNWNMPPASAAGYNGNERFGPFMFEMIGNFDKGFDPFDGPQRESALQVIAQVQSRFDLATNTLMFHNAMSAKSCPGNSLNYTEICAEVEKRRVARGEPVRAGKAASPEPFPYEVDIEVNDAIEMLSRTPVRGNEPADAELPDRQGMPERIYDESYGEIHGVVTDRQMGPEAARDSGLSAANLAALRPHLVNLVQGRFSDEGEISTTPADVDAIFEQHLPKALEEAKANGNKLRILFYAHGGLVSEARGLQIAAKHIQWWRQNDVYPIYFIWETGLLETLGQLLSRARQETTRGLRRDIWNHTLDPLIEGAARALQGPLIWGGMKSSAEHAVDAPTEGNPTGGGARYVAVKLKQFCDANKGNMELHAVGHSAGSIFHSYFLPVVHKMDIPTFTSVHFLAPAVRVDTFKEQLAELIGEKKAAQKLTVFTMKKDFEKDDDCVHLYHKSLLYLIHNALEEKRSTPILGLEESLRGDNALKTLFGLGGTRSAMGEVVWSVTPGDTGASASTSQSHGGFDDDAPTMNSIARRVLGKADAGKIVDYSGAREIVPPVRPWTREVGWEEGLGLKTPATIPVPPPTQQGYGKLVSQGYKPGPAMGAGTGRRLALCVGINRYPNPDHRLEGCVADAQMWSDTLTRIGFTTSMLLDGQATREAIEGELLALVDNSRSGDVIVFQYSGHGTSVPDLNGDEADNQDEAICPVDFATGALYIDDDIAQVFARVPAGVNLTCFMDCCHSGTNTRFAVGASMAGLSRGRNEHRRFVVATPDVIAAHKWFRQRLGGNQRAIGTGGPDLMKNAKYAACQDSEVAWESDGHGEFTLQATRVLIEGIENVSNEQFKQRVIDRFGMQARQHPMLDCSPEVASRAFLQPWVRAAEALPVIIPAVSTDMGMDVDEMLLAQLNRIQMSIQQLRAQLAAR